jgi:hypothetical protein
MDNYLDDNMTKRTRKQKDKNVVIDCLTYKRIGNKEVITIDNAIDYVKKMGYIVIKPKMIQEMIYFSTLCSSIILITIVTGVVK